MGFLEYFHYNYPNLPGIPPARVLACIAKKIQVFRGNSKHTRGAQEVLCTDCKRTQLGLAKFDWNYN